MIIFWTIVTFVFVGSMLLLAGYALVRPFTHIHYDHRDAVHPPWLEEFDSGPARHRPGA